jgi:hypothetical protein
LPLDGYSRCVSPRIWPAVLHSAWRPARYAGSQARRLWQRVFTERPEDPLPLEWIGAALVLSIVAIVWGWQLGGSAFAQNVFAALALLGPGLLLTNVVAVRLQDRRRAADRASRVVATVGTLVSYAFRFWLPIFNVFDQLERKWWADDRLDLRDELDDALDAEPRIALDILCDVMRKTASGVLRLTADLGQDELLNIGDTPFPTELLSEWRILFAVLNQHVPVPARFPAWR